VRRESELPRDIVVAVGVAVLQAELEPLSTHAEDSVGDEEDTVLSPRRSGRNTGPILIDIQEPVTKATDPAVESAVVSEITLDLQADKASEIVQDSGYADAPAQPSDSAMGVSQAVETAAPPASGGVAGPSASGGVAGPSSSPVREKIAEHSEPPPDSPVILITSSKASVPSPTTGLVSTSVLNKPVDILLSSPQPSTHEDEDQVDCSGDDMGIDYNIDPLHPEPSKFSNLSFDDFDADFPVEGKS
jgi:hypothetical protein